MKRTTKPILKQTRTKTSNHPKYQDKNNPLFTAEIIAETNDCFRIKQFRNGKFFGIFLIPKNLFNQLYTKIS